MTRRISSNATRALAWIWAAFVVSCSTLSLAEDFSVKDSGRQVADHSRLFWLDNERVLFQGPDGTYVKRADGFQQALYRLYVWNTRTGDIKQGERIGGGLCYKDGFVRYWRWKLKEGEFPKESEWYAGTFGAEVRVPREATNPKNFNWDTCKPYSELPPRPEWTQDLATRWLRPEHGLLVLGSTGPGAIMRNTPLSYCPEGKQERCIQLPLMRREARGFDWYEFREAYFVSSEYFLKVPQHPNGGYTRSPWPPNQRRPLWWLLPDGTVETIMLPPGPWSGGGSVSFYPTRVGVLVRSHNLGRSGLGNAGVYLVSGERTMKLVAAYAEASSVSPDGCRFVYRHDPYDKFPRTARASQLTLRALELCPGG